MKLPHPNSITKWTSSVEAEPGFFKEVFSAFKTFPEDNRDCNLVVDAMVIRKQVLWSTKYQKFVGFCDFGNEINIEGAEVPATEALVFMLVGLKGKWKWPIGYFFQSKCTATMQAQLIKTAITLSTEVGLKVWGVTCDGTVTNF